MCWAAAHVQRTKASILTANNLIILVQPMRSIDTTFTVVCAIECGQQLPAFRREPRDIGVSDVAKHFPISGHLAGMLGVGAGVTLNVTLSLLRSVRCLHAGEQNRELDRCGS